MDGKRLDFNAPLLSVRRFASAAPPTQPSSSSSANAATNPKADVGAGAAAGERPRRSYLPFYKSDLKSGPVRNPGVVPFVWEQSPGLPKDGSMAAASPARHVGTAVLAPKPPPGRVWRHHPDEKEEPINMDAGKSTNNSVIQHRSSSTSSSTSTLTTTTATTSSSTPNGTLSTSVASSREDSRGNSRTKPIIGPMAEAPISEEQRSSSEGPEERDEEEDAFSDALETLSRTESFFMNCSVSGMSSLMDAQGPPGSFSTDPQVRDFMMGRFLPAAQAVATGSPQCASRKPAVPTSREPARRVLGNGGELRRVAAPLPYQHRPNGAYTYPRVIHQAGVGDSGDGRESGDVEDDDEDEEDVAGHLSMRGCGLLPRFCLKSSFCLLSPVPGMKVRSRMPLPAARRLGPQISNSHHGPLGDAEDEHTWEEVYKFKLGKVTRLVGEERSKFNESNQLSYWSDSQTPDGSSPHRRSATGGVSPYRNDTPPSPFREGKGFLGVPTSENQTGEDHAAFESFAKDHREYWDIAPHLNSKQASCSPCPMIEKTVYVDSVQVVENSDSKLSPSDTKGVTNCMDKDCEIGRDSQRIETSPFLAACEDNDLPHEVSEVVDADELHLTDQSGPVKQKDNTVEYKQNPVLGDSHALKAGDQEKKEHDVLQALLPPPLPKSPSESWLWRTLPSISSKNLTPQSFLGFQFHPKRQVIRAPTSDPARETMSKTFVLPKSRTRFADVLSTATNVD